MSRGWFGGNAWRGSKWIRRKKRHLIYSRDDHKCLWCGVEVLPNETATLDHFLSREQGGNNAACNVFTCCYDCNCDRGSLPAEEYALTLDDGVRILVRIRARLLTPIAYREPPEWQVPQWLAERQEPLATAAE